MIKSLLLVDDEELFHLVFEDACSILDIVVSVASVSSTDEAEELFKEYIDSSVKKNKPECVFVDLKVIGSSYDGVELVNKINTVYGNNVVIGIISSSADSFEIERAKKAGAQFWIVKTHDLEPRLMQFIKDYPNYRNRVGDFKVYE